MPLLLAQSDVFRWMLTSGLREAAQRRIELPNMSVDCWRALPPICSTAARVEKSTAVEVLQAAGMYELSPLANAAAQQIADACDEGECEKEALVDLLDLAQALNFAKLTASAARALFAVDVKSERAAKAIEGLIADFQATEKALAAKAAGPLPGGYAVGEKLFYTGSSQTFPTGDKLARPARRADGAGDERDPRRQGRESEIPGQRAQHQLLPHLSQPRAAAAAAGRVRARGEKVFFTGAARLSTPATSSRTASPAR